MPEGDTVYLAAARLNERLGGRIARSVDLRVPRFATSDLSGRRVLEVAARGKHLLFRFDGGVTLHTHFRMDGEWVVLEGRRQPPQRHDVRAVITTDDAIAIGLRLPIVDVMRTEDEATVIGHLGPDPLGPDWDSDEVHRRMCAAPDRAIGEALLDQTVLAGVGNVYRSEICFLRGIHPSVPVRDVGDLPGLLDLTRRVMLANRTTGRQVTTGDLRRGRSRWVYGRAHDPCRRCGTLIQRAGGGADPQRVIFWCPSCQVEASQAQAYLEGASLRA